MLSDLLAAWVLAFWRGFPSPMFSGRVVGMALWRAEGVGEGRGGDG
jgi:hypothetical protein